MASAASCWWRGSQPQGDARRGVPVQVRDLAGHRGVLPLQEHGEKLVGLPLEQRILARGRRQFFQHRQPLFAEERAPAEQRGLRIAIDLPVPLAPVRRRQSVRDARGVARN